MYYIWGNVFLYCREHNIDFLEVCKTLLAAENKLGYETYKYEIHRLSNAEKRRTRIIDSTLEVDINTLTEKLHMSLEQIFKQQNYQERIVNMLKELDEDYWLEYRYIHTDSGIRFEVACETNFFDYREYYFRKYFDMRDMAFHYNVSVEFHWQGVERPKMCDNEKQYIGELLNSYYRGDGICLYDGKKGAIADYFEEMSKYKCFEDWNRYNDTGEPVLVSQEDYKVIDFKNIIVKSAVRKCNNENHHTQIVKGIFFILPYKSEEIKIKTIPLVYCKECNTYYMYDYEYTALCMEGKPLCRFFNASREVGTGNVFAHLSTESIFKICGYSVDANEDLSERARHNLLDFLIKRNIVTAVQTLNFLQWLINSRRSNPNMYNALRKWENDFEYIGQTYSEQGDKIIFTPE